MRAESQSQGEAGELLLRWLSSMKNEKKKKKNLWIFSSFFSISSPLKQNNSSFFIPQFIIIIYIFSFHRYYYCLSIFYLPYFSYCSLFYEFMNCCKWFFYPWKIISFHASQNNNFIYIEMKLNLLNNIKIRSK